MTTNYIIKLSVVCVLIQKNKTVMTSRFIEALERTPLPCESRLMCVCESVFIRVCVLCVRVLMCVCTRVHLTVNDWTLPNSGLPIAQMKHTQKQIM